MKNREGLKALPVPYMPLDYGDTIAAKINPRRS